MTPQQNGVVERKNITLEDMVWTMFIDSGIAKNFWAEATNIACYLTRSKTRNSLAFSAFLSQLEPKNIKEALKDADWITEMQEGLYQFKRNKVWHLVPRPSNRTIIGTRWVFRNELDEHRNTTRNKVRLIVQGYNQEEGIDYDETFAPLARMEAIRINIASDSHIEFTLFQMDVKSAFLNDFLKEKVYVKLPPGF
ncbi:uncharacterized mitochondrial protein AtMg00820-like [Nicotiana sylvestris]|uniref:uncharacterized mitochondrial protein AtMg00820-like n=1 Tax=Nicotiana sylvestris TaxID=4096 RepID=UPI00388CB287